MDTNGHERLKFTQMDSRPFAFYEYFTGGGKARLGLGSAWALKIWP